VRFHATVLITLLPPVLLLAGKARGDDGKEFTPKNGIYTITLPDGDTSADKTKVLTIGKHKVPIEASKSALKDGTTFAGASVGIPAVVMRDIPADKRFDTLRDAIVKTLNGKVKEEKDIKQDPIPGKEYQVELPKGTARVQLYTVAGWVVFAVVEGKNKDAVNSKQADAFFDSLKFTDKAKDIFRSVKR
jgi:hypothetical protein